MYCENFGKFHRWNIRKNTDKAIKKGKQRFVIFNSTLQAKILREMIVNQHIMLSLL